MSARLADPARSSIVLIGTPTHLRTDERLPDVPVVANNVADLAAVFTDPELAGFDAEHCHTAGPAADMPAIGKLLADATEHAEDLLLIYYAGHGLLDRRGKLYLALAGTHPDQLDFTALPYEALPAVCLDSSAKSKVVILDSCFSGRAIEPTLSNTEQNVLAQLDVAGTYTLTSAPANRAALILPGERHTAFTGRLLRLLREGHPEAGDVLSLGEIYGRLRADLIADGLPAPQQRGTNMADQLALVRNRRPAPPPIAAVPEAIQEGLDSRLVRLRIAAVEELGELLKQDDQSLVRTAFATLKKVAEQDNPAVARVARALIGEGAPRELLPATVPVSIFAPARQVAVKAHQVAATIAYPEALMEVLADIAVAWAVMDPAEARRAAAEAEKLTGTAAFKQQPAQAHALAHVARAWAVVDQAKARRIVANAEALATGIDDAKLRGQALVEVARGWAAIDLSQAERIAVAAPLGSARERAIAKIAHEWAAVDPAAAERLAAELTSGVLGARVLADAACGWAAVDQNRARHLATMTERMVSVTSVGYSRTQIMSDAARAWASFDLVKAQTLASEAELIARKVSSDSQRWPGMIFVVRGWAVVDPGEAEEIASTIKDDGVRARALLEVARGWAVADPPEAVKVAKSITREVYAAQALAEIARVWAEKILSGTEPEPGFAARAFSRFRWARGATPAEREVPLNPPA